MQPVDPRQDDILPSDHFGLVSRLRRPVT